MARIESSGGYNHSDRHVHVHLTDVHATYYDLVTEFLQAAGKAPDWYWRLVGSFGGHESEKLEEIISSAFEAGAFIGHDHPEDVEFEWVTEEQCEEERRASEFPEVEEQAPEPPAPAARAPRHAPAGNGSPA